MKRHFDPRFLGSAIVVMVCLLVHAAQGSARVVAQTGTSKVSTRRRFKSHSSVPTFGDPTAEDSAAGDDPVVRQAAVDALGNLIGSVIIVDPSDGRILSIVNQKMAFGSGYQPCSTFKPAVALAALQEGFIEDDSNRLRLGNRWYMSLQDALAHSNNVYFAKLGTLLGLEKLRLYAQQFGFGELAGWGIEREPAGALPTQPPPVSEGGVGKVASFGQGISMTLFQYVSFVSALANGGTLYYLQYPQHVDPSTDYEPRIKRQLEIASWLSPVQQGMSMAVLAGTARRAQQPDITIIGKTGTCSESGYKLGWFGGYEHQKNGLALVVLLRTGQKVGGSGRASQVAGQIFRRLADENYAVPAEGRAAKRDMVGSSAAAVEMSPLN